MPRVLSIPTGTPFLPTLARALFDGSLVPGFRPGDDPLAMADVTFYLPTRRAARALRAIFVDASPGGSAILPTIRALGEFDEEQNLLTNGGELLEAAPPIAELERILALAPLVQAWKGRLPGHIATLFGEDVVVPASPADAIWLARDLARLVDEMETQGADWSRLGDLVDGDLAGWWQVTLEFLKIVTRSWPEALAERQRSNPAAYRNRLIRAEATRLSRDRPRHPVIAAGSTGSIPATAELLASIARLPAGAVVLPGVDFDLDAESWTLLGDVPAPAAVCGHAQFGLRRLMGILGVDREDIPVLGVPGSALSARQAIVSDALRPAETTASWAQSQDVVAARLGAGALDGVTLVEAPNERDEALAIAHALRLGVSGQGRRVALATSDRGLARRVASELLRFGIAADDSAGVPLSSTPPGVLLTLLAEVTMRPGDPVALLSLLKHPLLLVGMARGPVRRAAEVIELVVLRGGTGRPDIFRLADDFDRRLADVADKGHLPVWMKRLGAADIEGAKVVAGALADALEPLAALSRRDEASVAEAARLTAEALEGLCRQQSGSLAPLYEAEAGDALGGFLRHLIATQAGLSFPPRQWPDVLAALMAGHVVKPRQGADRSVAIWGPLEARLQSVDLLVCGGLNEGSWPVHADTDGFLSRFMKAGIELDPPERRIGQAAHDFWMAMGNKEVVLSRAARAGDAPSVPSRWLQRLVACIGEAPAELLRGRGAALLADARLHAGDEPQDVRSEARPKPTPPVATRPRRFSVTEVETLRRDPYAIYARRILGLEALEPLLRDPGAAERGALFHDILHRFTDAAGDPMADDAVDRLLAIARQRFAEEKLPPDVEAVWWPRFAMMAPELVAWERRERTGVLSRMAEASATATEVGRTGITLSGRADRIDTRPGDLADILDYKTGSNPSKAQAHSLLAPQLALEGALLARGAFRGLGRLEPAKLAYVRLKPTGKVEEESILSVKNSTRSGRELAEDAWQRLERLLFFYASETNGYLSRALPFREGDTEGDYDHLARVLEWSAGAEGIEGEE